MIRPTISARAEDYLEAIWLLTRDGRDGAHTTDIAERLEVRKSSVTEALQSLSKKGLLNYQQYAAVTLTKAGEELARDVTHRHEVLRTFLTDILCINAAKADEEACRWEHAVSREVVERLIKFTEYVGQCPQNCDGWMRDSADRFSVNNQASNQDHEDGECDKGKEIATTADTMRRGDRARVVRMTLKGAVRKRMADMGVIKGALLEVKRIAPMGDPIDFKLKGYHLSLRKTEAAGIEVTVEP